MLQFPHSSFRIRPIHSLRKTITFTLAMLCLVTAGTAQEPTLPESPDFTAQLATLREKFDAALAKLDSEAISRYETLKARYGASGNLDAAIWAANQIATLKGEPPLAGGDLAAVPASDPVANERATGRDRYGEINAAEVKKLYLVEIARLQEETKRLTIAGDLDAAQATLELANSLTARVANTPPAALGGNFEIPAEIAGETFSFGKNRYYLFSEPMDHAEAVAATREIGGEILSIGSEEEYDHFHSYSVERGKPLWIDLQDEEEDLDWRHGSGEKASFLKWQSGEPNGGDAQKHVMIGYSGSWDMRDVNPDNRFYVVCEW